MIKVFNVMVKLFNADELIESAQSYFVVQDDKPNILQAMEIADNYATDNLGLDYAWYDDLSLKVYPCDGGCGIPYPQFLKQFPNTSILNDDDLYDMQFDFDDLPEESKAQAIDHYREASQNYDWWETPIEDWIDKIGREYGISIDQDKVSFSLGYVQGDFADFDVERVEDYNIFLKAIDIEIDKLPLRQKYLLKHILKEKLIDITMNSQTQREYSNEAYVRLDVFSRKYEMPIQLYDLCDKLTDLIDKEIDGVYCGLRHDLYDYIRNYYEENIDTDQHVIGYIINNGYTFDIQGEPI